MDFLRPLRPSWQTGSRRGARRGPTRRPRRLSLGLEPLESRLVLSDGTAAATVMVKDINPGSIGSSPGDLRDVNGTLFFVANDGTHGTELWKSNGTGPGTTMVADINPGGAGSYPGDLTNINGTLYFTTGYLDDCCQTRIPTALWKTDGTIAGTVQLRTFSDLPEFGTVVRDLTNVGGTLFFTASDDATGAELWKSDGNAAGTVLVKDIESGAESSYPNELTSVNGTLFFFANDGPYAGQPYTYDRELWKSDGTAAGTVLVKDINPGIYGSYPDELTGANGRLFFAANDGAHGTELWESDGTAAGTVLVKDIDPGPGGSNPNNLMDVNGTLFFAAGDGTTKGSGLWKSDGTAAGTVLVSNLNNSAGNSRPNELTNVNGTLFFSGDDGKNGRELWKSDGTARGTTLVKDIDPGSTTYWISSYYVKKFKVTTPHSSDPTSLTDVDGLLYFTANDGTHGREIWKSDGTSRGTVLVKDINPGGDSYPGSFTVSGGHLFFSADDGVHGVELWDPPISLATDGHVKHIVGPGLDNIVVRSSIASPPGGPAGLGVSRSVRLAVFQTAAAPSSARLPSPFLPATALPPWLVSPPAPSLVEFGTSGTDGSAGQDRIGQAIAAAGTHRGASRTGPSRQPVWDPDLITELASDWPLH